MFKPCFPDPPFFSKFVFRFYREFGIGGISKCTKHAFRLWFAMVGGFIDRHFYRKWPPIKMIKMIKMISDRLARDTLRGGLRWRGRGGDILDLGGFGSGGGYGICL